MNVTTLLIIAGWYLVLSAIAFLAFALDKSAAARGRRRIPERTLHGIELIGGWPGALAASAMLRHKSSKLSYRIVRALIIALHLAAWAFIAWLNVGS